MIHYAEKHGRAICGIMPNWSTSSWSAVTCPACLEQKPPHEIEADAACKGCYFCMDGHCLLPECIP